MAAQSASIPLRFQRAELEAKADLTAEGRALLGKIAHPERLVGALVDSGNRRDAVYALALMLPHRQAVWWACMAARVLPDLERRKQDLAAVSWAERWVQGGASADAERAGELANACDPDFAPAWVATAAYWSGPSIAPRGQQAVPPAPHLPGVAARIALLLLSQDPALAGRIALGDWLEIGLALMSGGNGSQAQAELRGRLAVLKPAGQ
ncbi:hypothetical protein SAMN05518801_104100 [Novosphingobium sp. CF614]|uniref:DUF6931 family protein n=1 Tax=Novosphingobium sp. CF614 TaxID=1884364 RepID=UPI0008E9D443|nr:hypothetical protein [Novosphingobium sp. CF614]SFF95104.1 hypothetical protein SAMN05518801_104100 [Novosphingobium sp. CF614]